MVLSQYVLVGTVLIGQESFNVLDLYFLELICKRDFECIPHPLGAHNAWRTRICFDRHPKAMCHCWCLRRWLLVLFDWPQKEEHPIRVQIPRVVRRVATAVGSVAVPRQPFLGGVQGGQAVPVRRYCLSFYHRCCIPIWILGRLNLRTLHSSDLDHKCKHGSRARMRHRLDGRDHI